MVSKKRDSNSEQNIFGAHSFVGNESFAKTIVWWQHSAGMTKWEIYQWKVSHMFPTYKYFNGFKWRKIQRSDLLNSIFDSQSI